MIKFAKPDDGLLGAVDSHVKPDWDQLRAEIIEMFKETRQTLAEYVPKEPTEEDDAEDNEQDEYDADE